MGFTGCAGGIFVAPQSNSFCKSLIQGMPSITAMILSKSIRGKTQMSALWQAGLMEYQIEYPQFYGLHCVWASGVLPGSIILLLGCSILKFGHICEQKSATDGAVSIMYLWDTIGISKINAAFLTGQQINRIHVQQLLFTMFVCKPYNTQRLLLYHEPSNSSIDPYAKRNRIFRRMCRLTSSKVSRREAQPALKMQI